MRYLFDNDITPPLSLKEIADFISVEEPKSAYVETVSILADALHREVAAGNLPPSVIDSSFAYLLKYAIIEEHQIPKLGSKKLYQELKRRYNAEIKTIKADISATPTEDAYLQARYEAYVELIKTIDKRLVGSVYKENVIQEARAVPLENFLEFKGGFARCPLHEDKTPSLKLYEKNNTWWCFSCGQGTDTIDLVMKMQGVSMKEAIKVLCGR